MPRRDAAFSAVIFALILASASAGAATHADAVVTVRTYDYTQMPDGVLARARETTNAIFEGAGISIHWIDCRVPTRDGAACTETFQPGRQLMLRLVESPIDDVRQGARAARTLPLGNSLLDHEARRGVLMTVDASPIRAIAEQASTEVSTVLGRAIAHEIGHLLLGTSDHPSQGLMRARWLQDELRGVRPARWTFSRHESAQMRLGLSVMARAAN